MDLPSGRKLRIQVSSFDNGRDLYQVIMSEATKLNINSGTELDEALVARVGMLALSSKEIEKHVIKCFDKVLIDDLKVTKESFAEEEHRQDYLIVLFEVTKVNVAPFMKSLFAQFAPLIATMKKSSQA